VIDTVEQLDKVLNHLKQQTEIAVDLEVGLGLKKWSLFWA